MNRFSRIRHHVDMKDVKKRHLEETAAKKLEEKRLKEEAEQIRAEYEKWKVDWRKEIYEAMTTSGLMSTILPDQGDTDLETAISSASLDANSVDIATNDTFTTRAFDVTKYDTIKFNVTQLTAGRESLRLFANVNPNPNDFFIVVNDLKANPVFHLHPSFNNKDKMRFQIKSFNDSHVHGDNMATYRFSAAFQRRTPMNVFVALDDKEASSFVRGAMGNSEEKRKRLKDMMDSSNSLMRLMGMTPSRSSPGDIQIAANWGDLRGWEKKMILDNLSNSPTQQSYERNRNKLKRDYPGFIVEPI